MSSSDRPTPDRKVAYWDYIKVEELLRLQSGADASEDQLSNDEVRFIVIHQIDELWFKLGLRELTSLRDLFRGDYVQESVLTKADAGLRRVQMLFELAGDHFRLMETMRTEDYLSFRDKLSPASGFQSAQMREVEILLGLEADERLPFGNETTFMDALRGDKDTESSAYQRVQRRIADRPSVKDAIYQWLYRCPIEGSRPGDADDDAVVLRFVDEFLACHQQQIDDVLATTLGKQALTNEDQERLRGRYQKELQATADYLHARDCEADEQPRRRRMRAAILFIENHRELPLLAWPGQIIDGLIAAEQSMLIFRQRHARMVERVIGRRTGTGGSAGVDYLDQTALNYRIFKEIWAARTMLLAPERVPPVRNREMYGLQADA